MKKILKIIILLLVVIITFQIIFLIGIPYKKTKKYDNDLKYVEWEKINIFLLTPFGDNEKFIIQLFPSLFTKIFYQKLIYKNKILLIKKNNFFDFKQKNFNYYISPNNKYILIQDSLHIEPLIFYNLDNNKKFIIQAPEIYGHYYGYPLSFINWTSDSKFINIIVEGTRVEKILKPRLIKYKQFWNINTENGVLKFINEEKKDY